MIILKKNLTAALLVAFMAVGCFLTTATAAPLANKPQYFHLKVYHIVNSSQEATIDSFLQMQYIPAMNSAGIKHIGVFKALANDTATDKKVYVFTPFESIKQWEKFSQENEKIIGDNSSNYITTAYNKPAFARFESIFMKSFELMPKIASSNLTGPKSNRVYELRSYESASEKLHKTKVKMFNQGGELDIFSRLGFNPVFYGQVLFGAKMPNLMYMTSFNDMATRDAHWKSFSSDPQWKTLSALPEYQNTVSHIDITFLRPAEYSQL